MHGKDDDDLGYTGPGKYNTSRARSHEELEECCAKTDQQAAESGLASREPMKPRHMYPEYMVGFGFTSRG